MVASAVLIVALSGLAPLFLLSARTAADGRRAPTALAAASSKLDQLLSLSWTFDESGAPVSDLSSDTSRDPPAPVGGTGLSLSPGDSLSRDTPGFVDYLTAEGTSVGSTPAAGAILSRRWLILPWARSPDVRLLRVCVARLNGSGSDPPPDVCLGTTRARR